jgi:hypothetical protein
MNITEVAWELYRDDFSDGKTWDELTEATKAAYIDYAEEVLEEEYANDNDNNPTIR